MSCKKIFSTLMLTLLLTSATVHAAKIDAYQKILDGGRYTIRYENFTPADRVTNRNVATCTNCSVAFKATRLSGG